MAGNLIKFYSKFAVFSHGDIFQELLASRRGISLECSNIQSTFSNAEINLKASIKRIDDI